jgi:hypothetical protein
MGKIVLYHGSPRVVACPSLALARPHNDYGRAFYTTRDWDLAAEWACQRGLDGFVNSYELWEDDLAVLDLLDGTHSTLEWVALLLAHRHFDLRLPTASLAREELVERFCPDLSDMDVVVGYRADDSYFSYVRSFVENAMPLSVLEQALVLGDLGEQVALVSGKAFAHLTFLDYEQAHADEHYMRFLMRDERARADFLSLLERQKPQLSDLYLIDILREEMTADDPRLRAHIPRRR